MITNPQHPDPLHLLAMAAEKNIPVLLSPAQAVLILEHRRQIVEEKNEVIRLNYQLQQQIQAG